MMISIEGLLKVVVTQSEYLSVKMFSDLLSFMFLGNPWHIWLSACQPTCFQTFMSSIFCLFSPFCKITFVVFFLLCLPAFFRLLNPTSFLCCLYINKAISSSEVTLKSVDTQKSCFFSFFFLQNMSCFSCH